MSVATGAVQESVRVHHAGETGTDPASTRGASGGRQISEAPEGAPLPALCVGTRPETGPGAGTAGKKLRCRTVGAPGPESDPAAVAKTVAEFVRKVAGVEADIREAHDLQGRSRREALNDEEWMTLSVLIASIRNTLWAFEDKWDDRLKRLRKDGGLSTSDSEALSASQGRLHDARRLFESDAMRWKRTIWPVRTTLPVGQRTPVVVESRIVPGMALGGRFAGGHPALRIAEPYCSPMYWHVSQLEQSVLTSANGEVLFSGLRHFGVQPRELDAPRLASLADEELRALIEEMYVSELGCNPSGERTRAGEIEGLLMEIGEDRRRAAPRLQAIRHRARCKMTEAMVTAALVADPAKLHRAIAGETVDLHLGVVAWPFPNCDSISLETERQAFDEWSRPAVRLKVNGPHGEPRTVRVNVAVSQFNMGHEAGFLFSDGATVLAVQELLGSYRDRELGGLVAARVRGIPARVGELRSELGGLGARRLRAIRRPGAGPAGELPFDRPPTRMTNETYRLERAMRRLEIAACSLQEAGRQVKSVWIDTENEPVSEEVRRQVAARLAWIACLMDWTPVTVSRYVSLPVRKLDAEIKFLATVADCNAGHLPPIDRDEAVWGPARSDFEPR